MGDGRWQVVGGLHDQGQNAWEGDGMCVIMVGDGSHHHCDTCCCWHHWRSSSSCVWRGEDGCRLGQGEGAQCEVVRGCTDIHPHPHTPFSLSQPTVIVVSERGWVQFRWVLGLLCKGQDCCRGKGLGNQLIQTPKILAKQPPQAPTI